MKAQMSMLKIPTPHGYKYYSHFVTNKGDYLIWSRNGKRYYLDRTNNSTLHSIPYTPFKSVMSARRYLKMRLMKQGNF